MSIVNVSVSSETLLASELKKNTVQSQQGGVRRIRHPWHLLRCKLLDSYTLGSRYYQLTNVLLVFTKLQVMFNFHVITEQ